MSKTFDFSGYATKNGLKCSDGRIILQDAFKHQDGQTVPLVWQHLHSEPSNILGHAVLENREDGVYCFGKFNETDAGKNAKQLVLHGDISSLSIYANQLKEKAKQVMHGAIREVSLVLSGANPGALIDNLSFAHGDGPGIIDETEAIIYTGIEFVHGETDENSNEKAVSEVFETFNDEQKTAVYAMIAHAMKEKADDKTEAMLEHADDPTVKDVFDTFNDEQKKVVYYLIGAALEETASSATAQHFDEDLEHNKKGESIMKHNVFDKDDATITGHVLSHEQLGEILGDAKRCGSLKESFMIHAKEYGLDPIDILFPDARMVRPGGPDVVKRDDSWVAGVLADTNHTPFSRIKTKIANLTADEARAKGYITGNRKKEEIIPLIKRTTTPTTVYKKQKLDRDDVVDITDFDVVVWLKNEMRGMLNEELARAVLISDGRSVSDEDKINEQNVRPIAKDDPDVFVHRQIIPVDATVDQTIDEVIRSREFYRGSGNPKMYTTTGFVTEMLLIKDAMGRRIYSNESELTSLLRVSKLIEVEVMNNATIEIGADTYDILAIIVNLKDYTIGADRGGAINMFDDFDIDYNQYKYLIETRISGALTMPKSAIVILKKKAQG